MEKQKILRFLTAFVILAFFGAAYAQCSYCCNYCPNNPPSKPSVYITPSNPTTDDDLYCYANSYDADGDTITYHYRWYRNGSLYTTTSTTSNYSFISRTATKDCDSWKCVVTAFDGKDYSEENYDTAEIACAPVCYDFELSTDTQSISMQSNDTATVNFWVKNHGNAYQCINLSARTYSSYIDAWTSRSSICLNPNESKLLALTIKTNNASQGNYTVKLRGESNCTVKEKEITVNVSGYCGPVVCGPLIDVVPIRTTICRASKGTISVLVKNLTNRELTVSLESSSTGFASSFEQSTIILSPRQERYVNLNVYTSCNTCEQYVTIYARADGYSLQRRAYFTVSDCLTPEPRNFTIEVPNACTTVEKMQAVNVAFTIKNLTRYAQTVNLQTVSTIVSEIEQTSITLDPYESRIIYIKAYAREQDEPKKHYIKVYAWQDNYREKKEICVDVKAMHKSNVTLANNDLQIAQCSFGLYTLNVENKGDTEESYTISINNPTKANIKLSESNFRLQPGEGKEIFITVTVPVDMPLGDYSADIVVENSSIWTRTIYFTVTKGETTTPSEPTTTADRPIIASYPVQIALIPGYEREVSVVVYNPTKSTVNATIEFYLPYGFYAQPKSISLAPEASETITTSVSADEKVEPGKYYDGKLLMRYGESTIEKPFKIYVEKPAGPAAGPGLFAMENPWLFGLLIIVAFVIIIFILRVFVSGPKKAEVMLYRR